MNIGEKKSFQKVTNHGAGEVVQQLRAGALPMEAGLIPNTSMAVHNHLYVTPVPGTVSAPDMHVIQTCM